MPVRKSSQSNCKEEFSHIYVFAGFRNCIGQKYAMLEMKSTVSKVLQHYEISLEDNPRELEMIGDLVLRTVNGIHLKIKKRN